MKKLILILLACFTFAQMSAKVWRVNPNDDVTANFTSIKQALDSAIVNEQGIHQYYVVSDGDTLYCEAGEYFERYNASTSIVHITRPVTLIGAGYGDTTNGVNLGASNTAYFKDYISISADNVSLIGLHLDRINMADGIKYFNIERCHLGYISTPNSDYMTVKNCFIGGGNCSFGDYSEILGNVFYKGKVYRTHNCTVKNNTFVNVYNPFDECSGLIFVDNIVTFDITTRVPNFTGNTVYNNIIGVVGGADFADYPNNLYGAQYTVENMFNNQGRYGVLYTVKDGHVAKTASSTGGEVGAYGGDFPFAPSLRPLGIPYIYDVTAEQDNLNQTLKLNFKAKCQDE